MTQLNTVNSYRVSDAKYSAWFLFTMALFTAALLTSNIVSVKLVDVFGLIISGGEIVFPLSYIFGDVLTEVYGYKRARLVIWTAFACNLLMAVFIFLAGALPAAEVWTDQESYNRILGMAPRLLVASFCAFLAGEFTNSYILAKLKIKTKGKHLWLRTITSTIFGQGIDSFLFVSIAFGGLYGPKVLIATMFGQWAFKTGYEILCTPITYKVVGFLKKKENQEVFDHNTNFNPFKLSD